MHIGRNREARRAYGFDEIALVPGLATVDPSEVDLRFALGNLTFDLPVLAAAMDGTVSVATAIELSRLGALPVLNLEGLNARYANPAEAIERIVNAEVIAAITTIQEVYRAPIQPELMALRIGEVKANGARLAVSLTPGGAAKYGKLAAQAGADLIVIQATVTTVRHHSTRLTPFDLATFCGSVSVPVIIGNVVTYPAALELMQAGAFALLVGVGPGAHCTTRRVLGIGVPQATAIADVAAARDDHERATGQRVSIIADGGMSNGGDVAKAIACGADGVMLGTALAAAAEAPGRGFIWGMATPDLNLPRGTRIAVGTQATLREILLGPAKKDDGTHNLMGALRNAIGCCGGHNVRDLQRAEIVIAPALQTEGKRLQREQRVGMGQ